MSSSHEISLTQTSHTALSSGHPEVHRVHSSSLQYSVLCRDFLLHTVHTYSFTSDEAWFSHRLLHTLAVPKKSTIAKKPIEKKVSTIHLPTQFNNIQNLGNKRQLLFDSTGDGYSSSCTNSEWGFWSRLLRPHHICPTY